jgi:uncharacterized coiled-coil protein SlyX
MHTACVSHGPRRNPTPITTHTTPRADDASGLRTQEQLKEYRFGRYVDPVDPLAMHESHPVYRVEASAGWNLDPRRAAPTNMRVSVAPPPVSANDAVVAEVNRQRVATRAFTEQTTALNQRLAELSQVVGQTQEVAKQNVALKRELAALQERLTALDAEVRDRRPAVAPPPAKGADKW